MHVVDTCGWIEWLTDGTLADDFAPFLCDAEPGLGCRTSMPAKWNVAKHTGAREVYS